MLEAIGRRLSAFFRVTAPDPFVLAILLTFLTLGLTIGFSDRTPAEITAAWADEKTGIWRYLGFGMQMCLILVTGHAIAASKPVSGVINALAHLPRTGPQAAALIALVTVSLGVFQWAVGLVGGALLARDVGRVMVRRGIRVHYPVLVAAGYVGMMVWHGGFSGTAPLKVSTDAQLAEVIDPALGLAAISLKQTLFSPMNLVTTGGLIILCPVVMALLMPRTRRNADDFSAAAIDDHIEPMDHFVAVGKHAATDFDPDDVDTAPSRTESRKALIPKLLEDTPVINWALALLIGLWAFGYFLPGVTAELSETLREWIPIGGAVGPDGKRVSGLMNLTPNTLNLTMFMIGLLLHASPMSYMRAIEDGAKGCAGVIIQFPLYAGIAAMMGASGLTALIAEKMAAGASETTLPVLTFFNAGLVNIFVPSGGGQWGVQGPIVIESALSTGVDPGKMVMALAYGDQITNMLQPFGALPLLAITGVKARDIVGYTAVLMLIAILWIVGCLLVF
ncbi:MAG: short-chain fatty acid transporter [Phycisphaerales bacterium JB050]